MAENHCFWYVPQRSPHPVIDISSIVGQTNCTVYFTIPSITYTPEIYHINYIGLELQNALTTSSNLVQYRFVIEVNLGANTFRVITQLIDVTPNKNTMSTTVGGFSPYQNYTATVSDTTVVGYGPSATNNGKTDPDSKLPNWIWCYVCW